MNYNIIDVINSLADKSDDFFSKGEVESSKIAQAEESLGVNFSKDFWKYTQKFGYIEVDGMELCGVVDSRHVSTVIRTQNMRELFSDFPMDCYVIESVGIDNAVMVQKSDGKIYQFLHGHELLFAADSLSEYLLNGGDFRKERVEYWKARSND
jgi:hypothetical protein